MEVTSDDLVRPGQVISSDKWNHLVQSLMDLQAQVAKLPGGGGTQTLITEFDPPAQQELGKELTVKGHFDFPAELNSVSADGIPITVFRSGTTGSQLKFLVPTGITIPPTGSKSVKVRVSNSKGQDEKSYLLLPASGTTLPNPVIGSVINLEDTIGDPTLLVVGKKAKISGQNFAANPTDNIIKFKVGAVTYPKPGQTLTIDVGQTTSTQIVVTVPDIVEIVGGEIKDVTLEVGVGATTPDSKTIRVFRE